MPRRSRYPASKSSQQARGRRSREKRQATYPPDTMQSKQVTPSRSIPFNPIPSESPQQTFPVPRYITRDLKRILIIAVAMLILLIILSLVL